VKPAKQKVAPGPAPASPPGPRLVALIFSASWCGYCPQAKVALAQALEKHQEAVFEVVDVETKAGQKLASQLEVQGLPTVYFFRSDDFDPKGKGSWASRLLGDVVPAAAKVGAQTVRVYAQILKEVLS